MGTVRITETNSSPSTRFTVEGDLLSQSTAGNYSVVRCYLSAYNGPSGSSSSYFGGAGIQQGTIAGVTTFATYQKSSNFLPSGFAQNQQRWRLGPYDVKVPHNSDGTRAPIRFGMVLNYGSHNETLFSGDVSLPTIPRASTATLPATVDLGSTVTINTNRASSAFTHTLQLWEHGVGATSPVQTIATGVGGSYSWAVPTSLGSQFPNATSKKFFVRTITYSGSTNVGSKDTVFTLQAPSSLVPTVSNVTVSDQNPDVVSTVGQLVQGLSVARFAVTAAGVAGSTIASRSVTFQGATRPVSEDVPITSSGNVALTGRATDTRGRGGTKTGTINVLAYSPPQSTSYLVQRTNHIGTPAEDGVYLKVTLAASVASLINSTERNAMTIRVYTKPRGTGFWTARNVITGVGVSYNSWFLISGGGVYAQAQSWDVRTEIHDKFGVYVADTVVSTAAVTLDLNGTNVGVGKFWEQGALDVAGQIFQAGNAVLDTTINVGNTSGSLASGVTGKIQYRRYGSVITVEVDVTGSFGANDVQLGTVPFSAIPSASMATSASWLDPGGTGVGYVTSGGSVRHGRGVAGTTRIRFTVTYADTYLYFTP